MRSGARFSAKAIVLSALVDDSAAKIAARRIGPALVFERLWEETGCRAVIEELSGARKHGFALERAVFLTVLHRLFVSGSDRAADRWRADYRIAGIDALELHHLYRAMAWLGEELPAKDQDGRTPFAPRCIKDLIEERLFAHRRDLLTRLADELHDTAQISDVLWRDLAAAFSDEQILELIALAGFYHMIAFFCNGLRLPREPWAPAFADGQGGR